MVTLDLANDFPSFQVHAVDRGSPQLTGTATVIITVEDSNNKDPTFAQEVYLLTTNEGTENNSNFYLIFYLPLSVLNLDVNGDENKYFVILM